MGGDALCHFQTALLIDWFDVDIKGNSTWVRSNALEPRVDEVFEGKSNMNLKTATTCLNLFPAIDQHFIRISWENSTRRWL